jgi:hypothetical protein
MYVGTRLIFEAPLRLADALLMGIGAASQGFILGGVFSFYLAAAFRRKSVEEISRLRFAIGGGLVAVLVGLVATHLGDPDYIVHLMISKPWTIVQGLALAAVLGGETAFGTIALAQAGTSRQLRPSQEPLPGRVGTQAKVPPLSR